jgi:putative transposase
MSSFSKILIHLTFSTKYREPLLPYEPFEDLHKYARGILKDMKCHLFEMNNVADHVHLLFDLHRTADVADIAMHLKKGTSHWIKEQGNRYNAFSWQAGYGAFSIGQSQRKDVVGYIRKQQEHHRVKSFQEEFRLFLQRYEIEVDERYIWD